MAALIHPLFAQTLPSRRADGTAVPAEPIPSLAAHPLQALLRATAVDAADSLMRQFMEEIDPAVQCLLAESRHAMETRALLDLGHGLSMNRPSLLRGFNMALRQRFDPLRRPATGRGLFDLDQFCLLPTEAMEENIALGHLTALAEQNAGEPGRQLKAQLQHAARDLALPALADALGPQLLPTCFAHAFKAAGLDSAERLLAYRLVESHALKGWLPLVQLALQTLDQQGFTLPRQLAANVEVQVLPAISTATTQILREARASLNAGPDGVLAKVLLQAVEPPASVSGAGLITALAGAWLDALLVETELPAGFAPDLELLRLPLIKAALCDPTFFEHPLHPVRQSVDALAQRAAFIGVQGYSLAPLRAELRELAGRINIHGQFAVDALSMLPPLDPALPQQFQQQMARDADARRECLLNRVRTLAAREIDARTLDVSLPSAARAALARGFLPLLCALLLRHGAASAPTRSVRQLLERFVDSFALCASSDERREVLKLLGNTLLDAGLPDLQTTGVAAAIEKSYAELEEETANTLPPINSGDAVREIGARFAATLPPLQAAGPATAPVVPAPAVIASPRPLARPAAMAAKNDPLTALLQSGQWFRVRDYKRGDDRWLSLTGVHLDQNRLTFSGFDGATALAMRASQFVEDLLSGLAEPLHPDIDVLLALQTLRVQAVATDERLRSFG